MPKKILIVDDEPDLLTVATFRLKKSGYQVSTAADGETAMKAIRESPPDLVLLDLRLPKISGYDICKTLKSDEKLKTLPVILFTASATRAMTNKLLETGADDFIIKPFDDDELLSKVKKFIG